MAPHSTSFSTSAALICLLLVLLPQSVVGFVSSETSVMAASGLTSSSSYKTSKLLQSSRVLPSDEASARVVSLPPLIRTVQNLQERLATYRHVRKQKKLIREASESSLVQGFVPVVRQFLYKPNKMFLQSYVMAHQQAQYDHMHVHHQSALQVSKIPTVRLSLSQRLAQQRREAKNARLAAKYASIESLEDRAFAICKDLGMI